MKNMGSWSQGPMGMWAATQHQWACGQLPSTSGMQRLQSTNGHMVNDQAPIGTSAHVGDYQAPVDI